MVSLLVQELSSKTEEENFEEVQVELKQEVSKHVGEAELDSKSVKIEAYIKPSWVLASTKSEEGSSSTRRN
jgi:hypothetical protein